MSHSAMSASNQTSPRPRPKVMTLTPEAAAQVKRIMAKAGADEAIIGVRIGVEKGGCAGMEYTMEYAHEIQAHDEVVEDQGVKILIDPKAILFLLGTQMHYKTDVLESGFEFRNPNQVSACGCGISVEITPANATLLEQYRSA